MHGMEYVNMTHNILPIIIELKFRAIVNCILEQNQQVQNIQKHLHHTTFGHTASTHSFCCGVHFSHA
jgi:hypothetical protein